MHLRPDGPLEEKASNPYMFRDTKLTQTAAKSLLLQSTDSGMDQKSVMWPYLGEHKHRGKTRSLTDLQS